MIFIALGSSIGDAAKIFNNTEIWLELHNVEVVKKSKILKNPPMGDVAKNEFSNAVWQLEYPESGWEKINWCLLPKSRRTRLKARKLLQLLHICEAAQGRTRDVKWEDRTLDLDLLMFDDLAVDWKNFKVPHPGIPERSFVLQPWAEIVDDHFEIPTLGTLKDLIKGL